MVSRATRKKRKFISVLLIAGILLILASYLTFTFATNGYLSSIQSEIAGVGAALVVIGIVFALFNVKIN